MNKRNDSNSNIQNIKRNSSITNKNKKLPNSPKKLKEKAVVAVQRRVIDSPYIPKDAIEIMNKFSDDRYKEICKYDESKSINLVNLKPSTPNHKKNFQPKYNNFISKSNNYISNSNKNLCILKRGDYREKIKISKDLAVKLIQRCFRRYLKKLRNNSKNQISSLLKQKKLAILKNYNIIDDNINISTRINNTETRTSLKEENKITGNFGDMKVGNIKYSSNIMNVSEKKKDNLNFNRKQNESKDESILKSIKDNIPDDSSFLSVPKYNSEVDYPVEEKNKKSNKIIEQMMNLNNKILSPIGNTLHVDYVNPITDNEHIQFKSRLQNLNKNEEEIDIIDIITNKDQTSITKNDMSDTVNVYEKIFKEIKKENESTRPAKTQVEEIRFTQIPSHDEMKMEELDIKIQNIESNIEKINNKYENITDTPVSISVCTNKNENYKNEFIIRDDKKAIVNRVTNILEIENMRDNINSDLNKILNSEVSASKNNSCLDDKSHIINNIHSILEENNDISQINRSNRNITNRVNYNTAQILNMELELKESEKTIETMKQVIDEIKRESKSKENQLIKEMEEKLSIQKYEYDSMLERQNGLIESLLAEKKKLTINIDNLNEKLDVIDKTNHKKIQQLIENFELEIKKSKDAWFQAEKIRRKKWEEVKLKEIKNMTVKGLEPEIERIISSHKLEITNMEDKLTEELRRQRDNLTREFDRRLQETKDRFVKEKEESLEHERHLCGQRMRNQSERLEEEYNEERRRWNSQYSGEMERIQNMREKEKKLNEDQIIKIEERNTKLLEEKENYNKLKLSEMEKRFEERIKDENYNFRNKIEKEKEKFIEEKLKEYEMKTKEMKNEMIKDRDQQIQIIIEKLGEDTITERKKIQSDCERRADEINRSLKIENEQMKQKIQEISDKLLAESKVRNMLDDNSESLSRKLQEKERELSKKEKQLLEINSNYNELGNKYSNISKEFNKEKLEIELEYKSKLQKVESEFKLLNENLDTVKSYYENKINDIQIFHKNEIRDIEDKIKKTLQRKDDISKKLHEDIQTKDITIQKYEELLAKQRKELLLNHN